MHSRSLPWECLMWTLKVTDHGVPRTHPGPVGPALTYRVRCFHRAAKSMRPEHAAELPQPPPTSHHPRSPEAPGLFSHPTSGPAGRTPARSPTYILAIPHPCIPTSLHPCISTSLHSHITISLNPYISTSWSCLFLLLHPMPGHQPCSQSP